MDDSDGPIEGITMVIFFVKLISNKICILLMYYNVVYSPKIENRTLELTIKQKGDFFFCK